ncbi:MAG: GntR family transcriptional regulator [Chloroflexota bacterium]|jgi:DNA-binding GntR family transcriptional regulator
MKVGPKKKQWTPPALAKVSLPVSLKEQAYNLVKAAILRGEFAAGVVFSQDQLSQWLGISRTPVREALLELQGEGLIRMLRGRGVEVVSLSSKDAREIIEIRKGLEGHAAALAASQSTHSMIEQLEAELSIQMSLSAQDKRSEFLESDRSFHRIIVGGTGNRRMQEMVEDLRDQFMRVGTQALWLRGKMQDVIAEHRSIFTALSQRDQSAARHAMLNHLEQTAERFLQAEGGQAPTS